MKTTSIFISLSLFLFLSFAIADENPKNIFQVTISKELYQGHFEGKCGMWLKDFDSMLEIKDENGIERELFTNKIDSIEINSRENSAPQITVNIGKKKIKGNFYCITYLVTDTGKVDLSNIKINKKFKLIRLK